LKHVCIFGGVPQFKQEKALRGGTDILIATPGRLLDLMEQGIIRINKVEFFVLDEADRMLDMGFSPDVHRVLREIPTKRQTLFFSATMPSDIQKLANEMLTDPRKVEITPESTTVEAITQSLYYVNKEDKNSLLVDLVREQNIEHFLIFTRTKHGADKLTKMLNNADISATAIHGNKSHNARQKALKDFKARRVSALVATDVAARGIDIDKLTHVINFEIPNEPESYVHRIGRSGRAGESGVAISLCEPTELSYLRSVNRTTKNEIPVIEDHPYKPEDMEEFRRIGRNAPRKSFRRDKKGSFGRPGGNRSGGPRSGGGRSRGPQGGSGRSGGRSGGPSGSKKRYGGPKKGGGSKKEGGSSSDSSDKKPSRSTNRFNKSKSGDFKKRSSGGRKAAR